MTPTYSRPSFCRYGVLQAFHDEYSDLTQNLYIMIHELSLEQCTPLSISGKISCITGLGMVLRKETQLVRMQHAHAKLSVPAVGNITSLKNVELSGDDWGLHESILKVLFVLSNLLMLMTQSRGCAHCQPMGASLSTQLFQSPHSRCLTTKIFIWPRNPWGRKEPTSRHVDIGQDNDLCEV